MTLMSTTPINILHEFSSYIRYVRYHKYVCSKDLLIIEINMIN